MQRTVLHIMMCGIGAGIISMLYFLLLAIDFVPFPVIAVIIIVSIVFVFRYVQNSVVQWIADDGRKHTGSMLLLAIACLAIATKSAHFFEKYGAWDAWAIWNLQAKYMASQECWRTMLLNTQHGHPDYPLLVPGITVFLHRLLPIQVEIASFAFSFFITLLIPTLLFLQLRQKNLLVAAYVLYMMATDAFYIQQGVSMYADTTLAFFFLCALVAVRQQLYGNKQVLLAAAALGCALWTKNEGVMLVAIFCAFYFKELFLGGKVKYFASGIALPLATWLVFKLLYAPGNDLLASINEGGLAWLNNASRYWQVLESFRRNIGERFWYVKAGVVVYLLLCLLRRQWPGRDVYMLLSCAAVYMLVYVATSQNLEWHLATSADRLLHQLMPAFIFVMADYIAGNNAQSPFIQRVRII
jgi:hypothetical protein